MLLLPIGHLGGGPETVRLLAKYLDRTRYRVSVVCPESPVMRQLAAIPDVELFPMPFPTVPRPAIVRQIAALIRRQQVDILHTHLFHGDLYGFLATRLVPVPRLLSTVQGINFYWETSSFPRRAWWHLLSRASRGIYRAFDGIATCSAAVREAICTRPGLKVRREQIQVIHNSVDAQAIRTVATTRGSHAHDVAAGTPRTVPRRLIVVANFEPFKGHRVLIDALRQLPPDLTFECLLVGEGPERPAIEALVHRVGLSNRVQFLGFRDDVPALIQQADLFVLPSVWEPFGIAIVETMLLGVPVVACRAGGVPEIITDDVTGLLVPPGDSEAMARAIQRILSDPTLAVRLAGAARELAERQFDVKRMIADYDAWYDGALQTTSTEMAAHAQSHEWPSL